MAADLDQQITDIIAKHQKIAIATIDKYAPRCVSNYYYDMFWDTVVQKLMDDAREEVNRLIVISAIDSVKTTTEVKT